MSPISLPNIKKIWELGVIDPMMPFGMMRTRTVWKWPQLTLIKED